MYTHAPDVIANDFEDEIVLLNLKTEVYYELNGVAARMYRLLGLRGEKAPVLAQLQDEFRVDEASLRRDLDSLVSDLVKEGILLVDE